MDTTFLNVTITVPAIDSREAYARLCSALASIGAEWKTDTFNTDQTNDGQHLTSELFACEEEVPA